MDRRRKVSDQAIRQIFRSQEPGSVLSRRFRVSEQMIYLIRSGRAHKRLTQGLERGSAGTATNASMTKADIAALADAIIDRLIKRLTRRDRGSQRRATVSRRRAEPVPSKNAA